MELNIHKNIAHLNDMHCLQMFIASQREFGGGTELAECGFDYWDLCQRWNGAFYPHPNLHAHPTPTMSLTQEG